MPIYEYQCRECHQKARKFWRSFAAVDDASLQCPRCGAHGFQRLVSRVAVLRSQDSHLEDLADPSSLADLADPDWVAVSTILDESVVRHIIPRLKAAGARGIVEYPLSKVID